MCDRSAAAGGVPDLGMAREGGAFLRPVRSAEARRASRAWARWSADRAVATRVEELHRGQRVEELQAVRGQLAAAEAALDYIVGDAEVAQRLRALLPAFVATLHGMEPTWLEKLRRNVALHAEALEIDVALAGARELRRAQRGPRLEARRAGVGRAPTSLSADAAEFVPGTWELLPVGPSVHVVQEDSEIHELLDAEAAQFPVLGSHPPSTDGSEGGAAAQFPVLGSHPPSTDGSEGGAAEAGVSATDADLAVVQQLHAQTVGAINAKRISRRRKLYPQPFKWKLARLEREGWPVSVEMKDEASCNQQ
ncbi:unnamed protein product [Prorocentrum cordatum]|uniref:Uncharacterized protein n=1 Tax=Prorocentrum cordatum TaxID=2364126 RepID=A0ABN9RVN9_9DINO|nr:unnamed protein product [Polarella glacialis]